MLFLNPLEISPAGVNQLGLNIKRTISNNYRVNKKINADEVRVIDSDEGNLGLHGLDKALEMAKERGLDLIEIVPDADPPVTKIYDFDKFRYKKEKEKKEQKKKQKSQEMKQIQISPRTAQHDLETKVRKIEEFLEDGHRVEAVIYLKGREKANKDFAKEKLEEFLDMIDVPFKVTNDPSYMGRGFTTQIVSDE